MISMKKSSSCFYCYCLNNRLTSSFLSLIVLPAIYIYTVTVAFQITQSVSHLNRQCNNIYTANAFNERWGHVHKRRPIVRFATNDPASHNDQHDIQLLGQGVNAPIQPGVVLLAPSYEHSHFLKHAAIFIYAMGTDEIYKDTVVRGVLLDHPTAFSMGEMCPGSVFGELAHKTLFTGGNQGKDSAMLFHSLGGNPDSARISSPESSSSSSLYTVSSYGNICIHNTKKIGSSGVYQGGIQAVQDIVDQGILEDPHVQFQYPRPEHLFKFFFNYIQFTQKELQLLMKEVDPESIRHHDQEKNLPMQDIWTTLQVPPSFILRNDWERGEAWAYLKNYLVNNLQV